MTTPRTRSLRAISLLAATVITFWGCKRSKPYPDFSTHAMTDLRPRSTFTVKGHPDWMAAAPDGMWVTSSSNVAYQLKAADDQLGLTIPVSQPCSGLAVGFGSLWIPSCGEHTLVRADLVTGKTQATIPISPADSEGGITVGAGSVWLMTKTSGTLSRIDPAFNTVVASISTPSGSFCPIFADGFVWITSTENNVLSKVDPSLNKVVAQIPVGKNPRFLAYGADSIWTLNQGDGTITRVNTKTNQRVADIAANLPGHGGEIAFGFGSVWATMPKKPLTRIDATTSKIISQWLGAGGDSIRIGFDSVWLTNYDDGKIWRLSPSSL
jgi:virginiamycin B lyase